MNITVFGAEEGDFIQAEKELENLREEFSFEVFQIDIHQDPVVFKKYHQMTPVMIIGPFTLHHPLKEGDIRVALGAAADREKQLRLVSDERFQHQRNQAQTITRYDEFGYWLSRHFMFLFNLFLGLYVGLPFLAPVLMKAGMEKPASVVYTIYSPLCHQLAFRSWFLFGEQPFYPRELANIPGVETYEEISGNSELNVLAAREFVGNEKLGYKVALCERDIAIYASMLVFGLLFSLTGNKIRPVRWYIWIFVGLVPIGLDGVSQLPGLMDRIPEWLLLRESNPLLRTITGGLFGLTTAWYLFPLIEMSMRETREILFRKIAMFRESQRQAGERRADS